MFKIVHLIPLLILIAQSESSEKADRYLQQFNNLVELYQKCSFLKTSQDFYSCLKEKIAVTFDELAKSKGNVELIPGYLELVADEEYVRFEKEIVIESTKNSLNGNDIDAKYSRKQVDDEQYDSKDEVANYIERSVYKAGESVGYNAKDNKTEIEQVDKDLQHMESTNSGENMLKTLNISQRFAHLEDLKNDIATEIPRSQYDELKPKRVVYGKQLNSKTTENRPETEVDNMLRKSLLKISRNRSLLVKLPLSPLQHLSSGEQVEEARKKKNNNNGMMLLGCLMTGGTVLSLAFGSLAVLAGKALMTSMLALMLSLFATMSKKGGAAGLTHAGTSYEVINVPAGGARDYKKLPHVIPVYPTIVTADTGTGGWNTGIVERFFEN